MAEVRAPVLALNGGKDVLVSAEENVPLLQASLRRGGNKASQARILPGLNHMVQTARSGMMEEAKDIEETLRANGAAGHRRLDDPADARAVT